MELWSSVLLAISLSIDSLGIGVSYGLRKIQLTKSAKILISLISILFTSCALFLGGFILNFIDPFVSKLIGSSMLAFLGLAIIYQALKKEVKENKSPIKKNKVLNIVIRSFKITIEIIIDPQKCDIDHSNKIDLIEAIYLGIALSVDSFTVGLSSVFAGINSWLLPILVAICQLIFLSFGSWFGEKISIAKNINTKIFVFISGLMMIFLSLIRLFF